MTLPIHEPLHVRQKVQEDISAYDRNIQVRFSGDWIADKKMRAILHRDGWANDCYVNVTLEILQDEYIYSSRLYKGVRYFYVANGQVLRSACKQFPRYVRSHGSYVS